MSRRRVHATGPRGHARALPAGLLGLAVAVALAACGSSGKGLIPSANAGPLVGDFETVLQAAQSGGGNCSATEAALAKTEEDFRALPSSVDHGLRANLRQGIANLHDRAHELCSQPAGSGTNTTATTKTTTKTTTTDTTPTTTTTAPPKTTTTPPSTTTTPPSSGGGTPAPGESQGPTGAGGSEEKPPASEEPGSGGAAGGAGAPEGSK